MSARAYPILNPTLPLPDRGPPNRIHPRPSRARFRFPSIHSLIPLSNRLGPRRCDPKCLQLNPTSHIHYRPTHLGTRG